MPTAIGVGALGCLGALYVLTHAPVVADETWLLQVVQRMGAGEALYRDIFCGTTPLAFWLMFAATRLFGVELAVVRLVEALCWLVSLLLARDAAARIASRPVPGVLAAAAALAVLPVADALYQPLATLLLLAALCSVLRWGGGGSTKWLAAAGCAAGLAFATKYTVGVLALGAVAAVVLLARDAAGGWKVRVQGVAASFAAFAAVAGGVLLVIFWNGAWPRFADYAFLNKGRYLGVAGVSYLEGFNPRRLVGPPSPAMLADLPFLYAMQWLPVLSVAGVAIAVWRRRGRCDAGAVGLATFIAAALLSLYPRPDVEHIRAAAPALLVGVVVAWMAVRDAASPQWRKLWTSLWGVTVAGALLARFAALAAVQLSPMLVLSGEAHFAAIPLPAAEVALWTDDAAIVRAAAARGGLFFALPDASRYYLAHRIPNPTPFDYPLVTAFGRHGEEAVIDALRHKRLRNVCLREVGSPLAPIRLEQFVKANLAPRPSPSFCTLYSAGE